MLIAGPSDTLAVTVAVAVAIANAVAVEAEADAESKVEVEVGVGVSLPPADGRRCFAEVPYKRPAAVALENVGLFRPDLPDDEALLRPVFRGPAGLSRATPKTSRRVSLLAMTSAMFGASTCARGSEAGKEQRELIARQRRYERHHGASASFLVVPRDNYFL